MNNEVMSQIGEVAVRVLSSKYGPIYVGMILVTGMAFASVVVDNKYSCTLGPFSLSSDYGSGIPAPECKKSLGTTGESIDSQD